MYNWCTEIEWDKSGPHRILGNLIYERVEVDGVDRIIFFDTVQWNVYPW